MRLRQVGQNALLILAGLLVALGALELALRVVDPAVEIYNPLHGFHQADAQLGWIGKADIRRRFRRLEFDVTVEHGPDGFRRGDPAPSPDASRRVLFLGDSFTWGWGVGQGEVFTDVLQRRLGPSIAIVNRGVNGYGTAQEYLLLQRELERSSYHLVVLLFFQNDLTENLQRGRYRPYFQLDGDRLTVHNLPAPLRLENRVKTFFKDHSRAFLFLNTRGALLKARLKRSRATNGDRDVEPGGTQLPAEVLQRGYELTRRLLLEMDTLVRRHGGRFVLVFIPFPEDLPGKPPPPWSAELRRVVAGVCVSRGIPFIDLTEPFASHRGGLRVAFAGDGHWNAAGHRLAAEVLLRSGLFERTPVHEEKSRYEEPHNQP